MNKEDFKAFVRYMADTYGVNSYLNDGLDHSDDEGLWVDCVECGDPILFEDWADDVELANGCCPICGERLIEEDELL